MTVRNLSIPVFLPDSKTSNTESMLPSFMVSLHTFFLLICILKLSFLVNVDLHFLHLNLKIHRLNIESQLYFHQILMVVGLIDKSEASQARVRFYISDTRSVIVGRDVLCKVLCRVRVRP